MAVAQVVVQNPQPTNVPSQKTLAATGGSLFGAAIATVFLWWYDPTAQIPENVRVAITVIISTIVVFLSGYLTPPSSKEVVVKDQQTGKVMLAR
jgi:hypothetical protein